MTTQLALPGLDPLTAAREERDRLCAAWEAVAGLPDSDERRRLQPLYWEAMKAVERLELGYCWWHGGKE